MYSLFVSHLEPHTLQSKRHCLHLTHYKICQHTPYRGFIVYLTPCSRLYQLNLLIATVATYNATVVVSNSVPENISQTLFCCILKLYTKA